MRARHARERARALRDRPARARRRRPCSTPAAASCAPSTARPTARSRLDFPAAPPGAARRAPRAVRRARARPGGVAAHRRRVLHAASSTDAATVRDARARLRRAARARPTCAASTSPRPATTASSTSCRAASPRGRHRRGPGHGLDALRARRRTGATASARRAARVPGVGPRRRGRACVAQGRPRAAHRPRGHDRAARASCSSNASRPVPGELGGDAVAQRAPAAPSRAARARRSIAPPLRNASPGLRRLPARPSPASRRRRRPASMRSLSVISPPPARFRYVPGATSRSAAAQVAAHDVVDVGELADLRAVAVTRERGAVDRGLAQPVDRHVGPLPRTEHREVPQRDRVHAPVLGVQAAEVLGRELGHAVRAERLGQVGLDRRVARLVAVHRRRRRVDDARRRTRRDCTASSNRCVASTLCPT